MILIRLIATPPLPPLFCVKVFQRNGLRLDLERKSLIQEGASMQSIPSAGLT
jgi:hypothetical protein